MGTTTANLASRPPPVWRHWHIASGTVVQGKFSILIMNPYFHPHEIQTNMRTPALLFIFLFPALIMAQIAQGGGDLDLPVPEHPCVSPELQDEIEIMLAANRAMLIDQGILPAVPDARSAIQLEWPLRQANGFDQDEWYVTVNFVDLDPSNGIKDYMCNSRSYNGHNGLDYSLWPFWWEMMDDNQVEIIAGAPGVILAKSDNQFDKNCSCKGTWNAVYIQHSDGSVAWYGHMKKNTLTTKPVGASVVTGEYLGLVGSSGCSTNPHLHLELHDDSNKIIEPYAGTCNNTTGNSWWADQKPYYEPSINRLTTHGVPPVLDGFCPDEYEANLQDQFDPGDLVYYTAWYRDQQFTSLANFSVKDPTGAVVHSWNQSSPNTYAWSWWWWSYSLPPNAVEGIWTFEATYNGETRVHSFQVGEISSTEDQDLPGIHLGANPVVSDLTVQVSSPGEYTYTLYNLQGLPCLTGSLGQGSHSLPMDHLPIGAYVIRIGEEESGRQMTRQVIRASR